MTNCPRTLLAAGLLAAFLLACGAPLGTHRVAGDDDLAGDATDVDLSPVAIAGRLLRVPLPITGNVDRRAIQQISEAVKELKGKTAAGPPERRPVLILQLDPGQSKFGLGSEFEDSLKLARYLVSAKLDGVKTVAFIPQSVKGHAVLVAMACEQIVMSDEAAIGDAGAGHDEDRPIDATILGGYRQIAESRHTVPVEIAEAMLDQKRKLLRVETDDAPRLVFAKDLAALKETRTIDDQKIRVIFSGGQPAMLSGRDARDLGVAAHLATDREMLARRLGLPRDSVQTDPFVEGDLRASMVLLDRYVDARFAETRMDMMDDAIREDRTNFLCIWIDCGGGDAKPLAQLATFIAELRSDEVLTIAYIPNEARGASALLALSCDDIVMHPDAVIGGGDDTLDDEQLRDVLETISGVIVPNKARSYSLATAMFKDDMTVHAFSNRRTGLTLYFGEKEFEQLEDKDDWQRGQQLTEDGMPLRLTGSEAENLDVASAVVDDFAGLKIEYGLEADPALTEPGWVDMLIRALSSPELGWLLVMIGLAGIYAEIQMPGIGVGGFVAAVAFTLYFWANFMNHTANELEIILFLVGISCLILEVFVIPGFGIFGLGGGAMILVSLILASQTFVLPRTPSDVRQLRDSLLVVGGAVVGVVGFAFLLRHYLPQTPLLNRLMLPDNSEVSEQQAQRESLVDYRSLLGKIGTTTTQLTPSGKASFGHQLLDVISDAELIPVGTDVEVVEVHGNRVLVKAVE